MNSSFALARGLRQLFAGILGQKVLALGLVAGQGALDDRKGSIGGTDFFDLHLFAFEQLVILEKTTKNQQAMRRKIASLEVAAEFGVSGGYGNDFVVAGARIDHGHQADGAGLDEGERLYWLLAEHQHI